MFTRRKLSITVGIIILISIITVGLHYYQSTKFKRTFEHGTTFEQLDVLLNTTRYADLIEESGYTVDKYNLDMNKRVSPIKINDHPTIYLSSPHPDTIGIDINIPKNEKDDILSVQLEFDKAMNTCSSYASLLQKDKTTDYTNILSRKEFKEYGNLSKKAIKTFLNRVYQNS